MSDDQFGVTLTVKYGQGFEAPWAVFRAATPDQAAALVSDFFGSGIEPGESPDETFRRAVNTALGRKARPQPQVTEEQALANIEKEFPGSKVKQPENVEQVEQTRVIPFRGGRRQETQPVEEPAQATGTDGPPRCAHGARVFKEGNGARGYWAAWFCPSSKNDPTKCDPEWIDTKKK